jgi:hypothetical protein
LPRRAIWRAHAQPPAQVRDHRPSIASPLIPIPLAPR